MKVKEEPFLTSNETMNSTEREKEFQEKFGVPSNL